MNKGQYNRTVSLNKPKYNKRACILPIKMLLQYSFAAGMIFSVHTFFDLHRKIFAQSDIEKTTKEELVVKNETPTIKQVELIKNDLQGTFYNVEIFWRKLVEEIAKKENPGIIIEVGMWSLLQCTFSSVLI